MTKKHLVKPDLSIRYIKGLISHKTRVSDSKLLAGTLLYKIKTGRNKLDLKNLLMVRSYHKLLVLKRISLIYSIHFQSGMKLKLKLKQIVNGKRMVRTLQRITNSSQISKFKL